MRRSNTFLIFAFLLSITILPGTGFSDVQSGHLDVVQATNHQVVLDVRIPEISFEKVPLEGKFWDIPVIAKTGATSFKGAPVVPQFSRFINLGADKNATVEVEIIEAESFSGLDIVPHQTPAFRDGSGFVPFMFDNEIYSTNDFWPQTVASLGPPAIIHGTRVAPLTITPFKYNPVSGQGILIKRAQITINLENTMSENPLRSDSPGKSRIFHDILDPFLITPEGDTLTSGEMDLQSGAYIIITDMAFYPQVSALASWKRQKGLQVEIYTTEDTGKTQDDIYDFLFERYYSDASPIDYVLFVGDIDQIPTYYGIKDSPSDHIYTLLEGDDYLPDVIHGRLSVGTIKEAQTVVNKMIAYEKGELRFSQNGYSSALMISGSSKVDDTNARVCGKYCETFGGYDQIDYYFESDNSNSIWNILDSLNQGRSWVTYFGHGSKQTWKSVSPEFHNNHISHLNNSGMLPVIVSIACSNGAFDSSKDSFAETWIKTSETEGAAGIFAASRPTPFVYTDSLGKGVSEGFFKHHLPTFGAACLFGKLRMYNEFPEEPGDYTEMVMQQFTVFSDPELNVWSFAPTELMVDLPESIEKNESEIQIIVEKDGDPLADSLVHIYREGQFSLTSRTDQDGLVTMIIPENISAGEVQITVTGKNAVPFIGTIVKEGKSDDDDSNDDEVDSWMGMCG